jgi:hypothetical protein
VGTRGAWLGATQGAGTGLSTVGRTAATTGASGVVARSHCQLCLFVAVLQQVELAALSAHHRKMHGATGSRGSPADSRALRPATGHHAAPNVHGIVRPAGPTRVRPDRAVRWRRVYGPPHCLSAPSRDQKEHCPDALNTATPLRVRPVGDWGHWGKQQVSVTGPALRGMPRAAMGAVQRT